MLNRSKELEACCLLCVGKTIEVVRGWQTPIAIVTCLAIVQSVTGHQQNLKKNLDELKKKNFNSNNNKLEARR
jgi:amino acid permease